MTFVPTFNLNASNIKFDDEELQKQIEADSAGGKYLDDPGNYDLEIISADFHANKQTGEVTCKGDSTWFNVKLVFADAAGRQVSHYLQVPTTKLEFGEKGKLMMFGKWQQFMIGTGEVVTVAKTAALLTKYFTPDGLKKLVGQKVNADCGYEGPYVAKNPDGEGYVAYVKGELLKDDGVPAVLPDRSSAIQFTKSQGFEPSMLRIMKFTAKKPAKASKAASTDW